MDDKEEKEEKFSNHPCHRLSVPSAKRFWCRHCFEMFDDPISRWRHSKACKNTGLSNLTRRKEQEAAALEVYCQSTHGNKTDGNKPVILPNLNPKTTTRSYVGPKDDDAVELSCFICKREFTTMEEMKDHVRVPCNKVGAVISDDVFPFPTRKTPRHIPEEIVVHRPAPSRQEAGLAAANRSTSPIDPTNLSSETMAAVEALNMMARSDKVNLTQFLNQLSEGGFIIEQAAGSSVGGDSQDREIVFTVQGDVDQSGNLLQSGGDITVEVAEDLIRMAQRVRVEAVERIAEEQVQEEVVQEDLVQQNEVQYFQDQDHFIPDQTQYVQNPAQYEEQPQYGQDQSYVVKVDDVQETAYPTEEASVLGEQHSDTDVIESEDTEDNKFTVLNMETGQHFTGEVVLAEGSIGNINVASMSSEAAPYLSLPADQEANDFVKNEGNHDVLTPGIKRKLEEENIMSEGHRRDQTENVSQVKKLCTKEMTDQISENIVIKEELSEAKKKLRFYSDEVTVQEKCNKNFESSEKNTLEDSEKQPCDDKTPVPSVSEDSSVSSSDTHEHRTFLDEVDGCIKPMTEEMIKHEEMIKKEILNDLSTIMTVETMSHDEMTVIKKKHRVIPLPSPKKLRSSSRKLILTPKKLKLLEEKERTKKRKKKKGEINHQLSSGKSSDKTKDKPKAKEAVTKPVEKAVLKCEKSVEHPVEKPVKIPPPKPVKCRACDKVFSSLKHLQRHKTMPCVIKITRNMCQKVLRPKRALPRLPERKIVKKKPVVKEVKKPKLLPVGFQIQAQWIPCKVERRPSKGRGRPRKHIVHYERQKRIVLPDRTIEVSSLSEKEQFLFDLGLVSVEYVDEELRRPVGSVEIMSCLSVNVGSLAEKSTVCDISPPLLEKIEPTLVNECVHNSPPDLTTVNDLEPPVLEPIELEQNHCLDVSNVQITKENAAERHFLDSFPVGENSKLQSETSIDPVSENVETTDSPKFITSQKKSDMVHKLKTALRNVCSPQKLASLNGNLEQSVSKPGINSSPQSKRNLFETLHAMCSNSPKTHLPSSSFESPSFSVSSLCNSSLGQSSQHTSPLKAVVCNRPRKKCTSAQSSPRKTPNILLRRCASESGSLSRHDNTSILDIVAQSMGVNMSGHGDFQNNHIAGNSNLLHSSVPCDENSASRERRFENKNVNNTVKKKLFEKCERLHDPVNCEASRSENTVVDSSQKCSEKSKVNSGKLNKSQDLYRPLVSLSSSKCGQVLVSPLGTNKTGKNTAHMFGVKQKLCDASTQCTQLANVSPVKTLLGDLEHKFRMLKSALEAQTSLTADLSQSKKGLLPEIVSALLKYKSHKSKAQQTMNSLHLTKTNLPDVVASVTENKLSRTLESIDADSQDCENVIPLAESSLACEKSCFPSELKFKNPDYDQKCEKLTPELSVFHYDDSKSKKMCSTTNMRSADIPTVSDKNHLCSNFERHSHLGSNNVELVEESGNLTTSQCAEDTSKVKVQYIEQSESDIASGVTYLLLQQEGMEEYLHTVLSADLDLLSRETIHAVTDEEEIMTDSLQDNVFNSDCLSRTIDCEVLVSYSGS